MKIAGVILAGGLARRMGGGDKALLTLAEQTGLTLIGRMRGQRVYCLSGAERLVFDSELASVGEEDARHVRKGRGGQGRDKYE